MIDEQSSASGQDYASDRSAIRAGLLQYVIYISNLWSSKKIHAESKFKFLTTRLYNFFPLFNIISEVINAKLDFWHKQKQKKLELCAFALNGEHNVYSLVPNIAVCMYKCIYILTKSEFISSCSGPAVGSNIVQITRTTFFVNVFFF